MLTKSKIKLINQLKIKKYREIHRLFIVEGANNTIDYLESDMQLTELFITSEFYAINESNYSKYSPVIISEREMKQISSLKNPSGIVGIFRIPEKINKVPIISNNKFYLVLDDLHDPGNLGTIIRTADWFGINNVICSESSVDAFNPKVVQATMGSLSRIDICYCNLKSLLSGLNSKVTVYGAVLNGEPVNNITKPLPGIILIGSEARGINQELLPYITNKITIPLTNRMGGKIPESLNASVATAIICYSLKVLSDN